MSKKKLKLQYIPISLDVEKGSDDYMLLRNILRPDSGSGVIFLHSGWYPLPKHPITYHFMIGYQDFEKFFRLLVKADRLLKKYYNFQESPPDNMINDLIVHLYGYINF